MKFSIITLLMLSSFVCFSQTYTRRTFDYEKFKIDTSATCGEETLKNMENSLVALQENDSKNAVAIAKKEFDKNKNCPQVFDIYAYSLFRSGEWFEGIEIIEKGIEKFGAHPNLIKRKSVMSLEMAELGTGQKNIDGNSVYKANALKYDEDQFKDENLNSALKDLEYLVKVYNRNEEKFYVARIQQVLKNFTKSNEIFQTLLDDEEYKTPSIFSMSENYIGLKKFDEAENEINKLLKLYPKEGQLLEKLAEIYELKDEKAKSQEFKRKATYYNNIPNFVNLEYSDENFELLKLFGTDEHKADKKISQLNEIVKKGNQDYTIDICLIILKLHSNHGNGVEEEATEILKKIGKSSIEKVNLLFQSNVSTCTITNLSDIMATVKDEKSWELLKEYLAQIAYMPATLIPPSVPAMMVKFDEDRGIKEILIVVKELLKNDATESDDPMAQLGGFGQYVYYSPLKEISKSKLKKIATELNYTNKEFKQLEDKIE